VAAALTNTAWRKICAAAERRPNAEAEARAALSKLLFDEYPGHVYDRERVAKEIERAELMLEQLDAFAKLYRGAFLPGLPADQFEAVVTGRASLAIHGKVKDARDLWGIAGIRWRVLSKLEGALVQQEANSRNRSEQRAWLYHWLCEIWLDYFEPELPDVGPPRTPLVTFILTAMRLVMPKRELPKDETVRDAIDRQRARASERRIPAREGSGPAADELMCSAHERRGFCHPKIAFQNPCGFEAYWLTPSWRRAMSTLSTPLPKKKKRKVKRTAFQKRSKQRKPGDAHTIPSFCAANHISESLYHTLKRQGRGPREIELLDKRIIITPEAEVDWRAEREAETQRKRQERAAASAANIVT
jgi:hypothetical protein